jgi:hypothetical protein
MNFLLLVRICKLNLYHLDFSTTVEMTNLLPKTALQIPTSLIFVFQLKKLCS